VSRYRFIAAEKAHHPVSLLCRVLGVSRASFYAWCDRGPSVHEQIDQQLLEQISRIHRASRGTPTAPHACMPSSATTTGTGGPQAGRSADAHPMGWSAATAAAVASPAPTRPPPRRRIWSGGCSTRARPTGPGLPTSATSLPGRAGYILPRSWMAARGRWLAGPWPTTSAPSWPWTPCRRPCSGASRTGAHLS
jgi:hypothetical protein